jgi:hypothetical protein
MSTQTPFFGGLFGCRSTLTQVCLHRISPCYSRRITTFVGHIALGHPNPSMSTRIMVSRERLRLSGFLFGREKGP